MFYDRFVGLCKERGVSPSAVMVSIGLNKSNATFWKKGSIPKGDTLQKLADYFDVSTDYLLGKEAAPFKVGDSFVGDRLRVTKVKNNGNGTFDVSFSINHDGMTPDEFTEIWDILDRMSKDSGVPIASIAQFTESINRAIQSTMAKEIAEARHRAKKSPQEAGESTPAAQEGKDTTPPADAPETASEGE